MTHAHGIEIERLGHVEPTVRLPEFGAPLLGLARDFMHNRHYA
ncbi:hypothetical protein UA75_15330 [Actinoalloteichus sp. GBA129-24]|uniref:Uncharacterized protein n=1 Tax=Actinoalloteichus fjordicus TaxID=1612552 RepID=A0AAC9PSC9_9PSEU|nr:hypothetical protein UA74_14760 [Actinoalloteichus fjordicus]APU21076.1 hypothetical protein UA75_15330 [Actinoalloteichus sp. GBA129-24]